MLTAAQTKAIRVKLGQDIQYCLGLLLSLEDYEREYEFELHLAILTYLYKEGAPNKSS